MLRTVVVEKLSQVPVFCRGLSVKHQEKKCCDPTKNHAGQKERPLRGLERTQSSLAHNVRHHCRYALHFCLHGKRDLVENASTPAPWPALWRRSRKAQFGLVKRHPNAGRCGERPAIRWYRSLPRAAVFPQPAACLSRSIRRAGRISISWVESKCRYRQRSCLALRPVWQCQQKPRR